MSNICAGCNKRVYAAEWLGPVSGKYYHKLCFSCNHCKKPLQLGQSNERDGVPYCKSDYARLFAIKGFGHGGMTTEGADPSAAAENKDVIEAPTGETAPSASSSEPTELFKEGCPKCGKKVYFNEKAVFNTNEWHQKCFHCTKCKKPLYGGQFSEHGGLPYCKRCHESNFGAKGFGYGGATVLH